MLWLFEYAPVKTYQYHAIREEIMDKKKFIQSCYLQLVDIFQKAKLHQKDDKQKHRTEGFMQAGKFTGMISNEEAVSLMEKAHYEVFGETIASRKSRKKSLKEAIARGDDDYIAIPAYERNKT
jgi:hypothetical protein